MIKSTSIIKKINAYNALPTFTREDILNYDIQLTRETSHLRETMNYDHEKILKQKAMKVFYDANKEKIKGNLLPDFYRPHAGELSVRSSV